MRKVVNRLPKIITFAWCFLLMLSLCACGPREIDVNMFADMDECLSIESIKGDGADVEIFDPAEKDKNLKKLEVEESFGCKYSSDDFTFRIYAYVFSDSDSAMIYFENETGKDRDPNPTFSDNSGMSKYRRIAVNENKAYIVWCSNSDNEEVIEFLNSWFSVELFGTSEEISD